ncbi:alkaline phosphatase [Companilactobacillus farciminis]|nr:alkaline phosphatase [Companilactobacillus farciminis]
MNKLKNILNKRLGFMALLVALLWIKTIIAYYCDFSLGVSDPLQHFILIINPIATAVILLSIALYINRSKISYIVMGFIYVLESALLYGNILYYREFSDFLSFNTIAGAAKVSKGLGGSAANLVQIHDFIYGLDFIILAILLLTHYIKIDPQPMKKLTAIATTFFGNLSLLIKFNYC